ncbi:MAG: recombinase family protein [Myxacorys chilensis ATA2-1-KO14]|jgi:DNA invertase Pin-like site-specific DNA recombinase|nr:recombinase family protein [Myxacorys chilensis ATA2-1-KO14]
MLIGYRRISPDDQTLDLQTEALNQAGCNRIWTDITTEPGAEQPGLDAAIASACPGDVFIVWRLDRIGKPLKPLLELVADLNDRGVGFKSLEEDLDTRNYDRSKMLRVLRALVNSEQQVMTEKTRIGLKRARARGKKGGRKPSLTPQQIRIGKTLAADPTQTVEDVCRSLKISASTYYRYIHPKQQQER